MAKIEGRWDSDFRGNSVMLLSKKRGHINISEITDWLFHADGGAHHGIWAVLLKCDDETYGGNGLWCDDEPEGDCVELVPLESGDTCPLCGKVLPVFDFCPECGAELNPQSKKLTNANRRLQERITQREGDNEKTDPVLAMIRLQKLENMIEDGKLVINPDMKIE